MISFTRASRIFPELKNIFTEPSFSMKRFELQKVLEELDLKKIANKMVGGQATVCDLVVVHFIILTHCVAVVVAITMFNPVRRFFTFVVGGGLHPRGLFKTIRIYRTGDIRSIQMRPISEYTLRDKILPYVMAGVISFICYLTLRRVSLLAEIHLLSKNKMP